MLLSASGGSEVAVKRRGKGALMALLPDGIVTGLHFSAGLGNSVTWCPPGWWANRSLDLLSKFTKNASFAQLLLFVCRKNSPSQWTERTPKSWCCFCLNSGSCVPILGSVSKTNGMSSLYTIYIRTWHHYLTLQAKVFFWDLVTTQRDIILKCQDPLVDPVSP